MADVMVRALLINILKTLEQRMPPPAGHHAITYAQYGSDEAGWEDRLALHVRRPTENVTLFLDEGDFLQPFDDLINEIVKVAKGASPDVQQPPADSAGRI